jgi:hypothetical protein
MRGSTIFGPYTHAGLATDKSIISVVAVDGFPPPKIITFGA